MKNTRPSGPLCQNCTMTELYCACVRDIDRRPCCGSCEHISLGPTPDQA